MAEQKLPKPWVGRTEASAGSSATRCRTGWYRAWVRSTVSSAEVGPVRPVDPWSVEPPVNTAPVAPVAPAGA